MVSDLINDKLQTYDVCVFLKLYLLLFADETIIMAESATELQDCLNAIAHYCRLWSLKINTTKTKVLIFSKGKTPKIPTFSFNGTDLDVCFDYVYLGVNMNYNGRVVLAKQRRYVQAQKTMYSLIKKSRQLLLPINLIFKLFDHSVVPILLYGCEVWGYENCDIIEKLHLEFCRMVLHVNKSTSKCMIYGELGRAPLVIQIKQRMANFWIKLAQGKDSKLSVIKYRLLLTFGTFLMLSVTNG